MVVKQNAEPEQATDTPDNRPAQLPKTGPVKVVVKSALRHKYPLDKNRKSKKGRKVVVDITEETWDNEGTMTRTTIQYITEADGTRRQERSVETIPAAAAESWDA